MVRLRLNEKNISVKVGTTVFDLVKKHKPEADLIIYNGGVVTRAGSRSIRVKSGDSAVLIKRGEVPNARELESLLVARHTPGVHEKVKKACVGIAGLGGLGSHVSIALARVGVGRLVIADFDVVEPSNLNRQMYFTEQIGEVKAYALKRTLKRVNPYVKVEARRVRLTEKNVPKIFKGVDVMVEAFDLAEAKAMLVQSFSKRYPKKPIVIASGVSGYGRGGQIKTRKIGENLYVVGDQKSAAGVGRGLMAPRVGIAAHQQANLVLRIILGRE